MEIAHRLNSGCLGLRWKISCGAPGTLLEFQFPFRCGQLSTGKQSAAASRELTFDKFGFQYPYSTAGIFMEFRVGAAKDALVGVQSDRGDPLVFSRIPLLAIEFDFGQFRHADRVKPAGAITISD